MKRSRHRWLGFTLFSLSIVLLAIELPTTSAARATSLIFSKSTSTTTAPDPASEGQDGPQTEATAEGAETQNTTNKLSGIPQIDYIYDPNLPRELNGYNLSEYPFYETVPPPETMDFKCDGLHDGFYASVPHKCQVYHHCLFGTRYDFLCANYTAFDQKTFICHFVSEVDCKNSPNYFNRNEALYKATTQAPPPPPPSTTTTTTTTARPPRPARRRPHHRYDYYDDDYYYPARDDYDYEEGRRRRPRPRPQARPGRKRRPYDDYDDDRYERRPRPRDEPADDDYEDARPYDRPRAGKRPSYNDQRRPYNEEDDRRPGIKNGNRRPGRPRDDADRFRDDEDRPRQRDQKRDDVKPRDEIRPRDEVRSRDEIRPRDEVRPRDEIRPRDEVRPRDEIRPRDEVRPRDDVRPRDEGRLRDEIRPRDERRPSREESRVQETKQRDSPRPRDERYPTEGRRYRDERPFRNRDERPHQKPERNYDNDDRIDEKRQIPTAPEGQPLVKPNGHGIFSQPRIPPKIKRPVPANEKGKYEYVTVTTTKAPSKADDDEYYDDYEEEDNRRPSSSGKSSTVQRPRAEPVEKEKFKPSRPHITDASAQYKAKTPKRPIDYDVEDYYYETPVKSQKYSYNQKRNDRPVKSKVNDDYYYDDEVDEKKATEKSTQKNLEEDITSKIKDIRPNVKVVRRPFLPSRGGSPYLPRGLQPVAGKNMSTPPNTTPKPTTTSTTSTTTTTTEPPTTTTTTTPTTTTTTTEKPITTTTAKLTTIITTENPTTSQQLKAAEEEEYEDEYYDEEDIDYDAKHKKEHSTTTPEVKTNKPTTTTEEATTPEQKAQFLAAKVLRVYNDNYEAIREKLETTLSPGDYLKPYLATEAASYKKYSEPESFKPKLELRPEISKPYTATGKPIKKIPETISIKQNLADSIENDYDVALNEALTPNLPNVNVRNIPSGFIIPGERDYGFTRFRNNFHHAEPQYAASELTTYQLRKRPQISGVNIRTPSSYFLHPQRYNTQEDGAPRPPRQLVYRQVVNQTPSGYGNVKHYE